MANNKLKFRCIDIAVKPTIKVYYTGTPSHIKCPNAKNNNRQ